MSFLKKILFTDYEGLPASGEYAVKTASAILIDRSRIDPYKKVGSFCEVPVYFYYPETEAQDETRFPLVFFSHGAFGYYKSNYSTYHELASNGYVVAAVDHPHHALMTRDTKKKRVLVDRAFMKEIRTPFDETEKHYELCVKWMKLRTADLGFAIDTVKAAAASGARDESWFIPDGEGDDALRSVLRITDPVRLGLIGHSMGGAAAVAVGRQRGDVSAVIDLDGTMLGEYLGVENGKYLINSEPYPTPILEFSSWEAYTDNPAASRREVGGYPNDVLMRNAAAGFFTTIRDTKHMDFTDLPLFSPFLGKKLGKGERDTAEAMQIVNSLVLSFFNCYLKGEGVFTVQKIY